MGTDGRWESFGGSVAGSVAPNVQTLSILEYSSRPSFTLPPDILSFAGCFHPTCGGYFWRIVRASESKPDLTKLLL